MAGTSKPTSATSIVSERVVLLFLLAAALVLSWIYFLVMPREHRPTDETFDLRNPLLGARLDECVQIESTTSPGSVACLRVREPGVVLRPREGPDGLGIYRGLHRGRPYLACSVRNPPPGASCSDAASVGEEIELFDLNGFGMPYSLEVSLDVVRQEWVQRGGRYLFVYEAQLTQYGPAGTTWMLDIHPDAPVTGIVRRRYTVQGGMEMHLFTAADDCR